MDMVHDLVAMAMLVGAGWCICSAARDFVVWRKEGRGE
jgi:hypothetical protein